MSRRHPPIETDTSRDESLVARARRFRRRGDARKMLTALREACLRDEEAAWLWTLYGAMLAEHGRTDDAVQALRHALWLRHGAKDVRRERSTKAVLDRVSMRHAA